MARGLRDAALETGVGRRGSPYGRQSCGHGRPLCARHRAAGSATNALDRALVLGVLGWGRLHGQGQHRTDATTRPAGTLTAAGVHAPLGDAIREASGRQDCHHRGDRLPLLSPTGAARTGLVVPEGKQRASTAVGLAGGERTAGPRPQRVRRQRCPGAPRAWRAWARWPWWRLWTHETLSGLGGEGPAVVSEAVCPSLLATAGGVGLGLPHGLSAAWRCGGAVATGRTIPGGQTPRLGLMALVRQGLPGDVAEPGDHAHTADWRSDQRQSAAFAVRQLGLHVDWQ